MTTLGGFDYEAYDEAKRRTSKYAPESFGPGQAGCLSAFGATFVLAVWIGLDARELDEPASGWFLARIFITLAVVFACVYGYFNSVEKAHDAAIKRELERIVEEKKHAADHQGS